MKPLLNWVQACVAGLALMVAACASDPGVAQVTPAAPPAKAATTDGRGVAPVGIDEYRLASGDSLRITVFGEPELSGQYNVDGTGIVSLPLIGEVQANGMTVREFQRRVEARLADGFLREPRVSAEVTNYRPYYILGEVAAPGEYPYTNGLTVMNAIATAKGFTYRANQKKVRIKSATDAAEREVQLTPDLPVQPGDTIRIKERLF